MATVTFDQVNKVYPGGTHAVSDLALDIAEGTFMVLIGPSGCGKTTAMRMVAGLEEITAGEIRIDGQSINRVEPQKRDVAMVFQNYALYPHMTVFDNLAFPLQSRGMRRADVRDRVQRTAATLGLKDLLERRPRALSGGQRQRVAMGRALVREPKVFLMDEPLSNLDAKLRVQMRAEIRTLQRDLGVTTIYVTHDQVEAMTMGSRIAVLRKGVLQQEGVPDHLYDRPANLFVATFLGSPAMNLFRGRIELSDDKVQCMVRDYPLALPGSLLSSRPRLRDYAGRDVAVGIRPEHLLHPTRANPADPRLRAAVHFVESLGSGKLVHADVDAEPVVTDALVEIAEDIDAAAVDALKTGAGTHRATLTALCESRLAPTEGTVAEYALNPDNIHFFDLADGIAISS